MRHCGRRNRLAPAGTSRRCTTALRSALAHRHERAHSRRQIRALSSCPAVANSTRPPRCSSEVSARLASGQAGAIIRRMLSVTWAVAALALSLVSFVSTYQAGHEEDRRSRMPVLVFIYGARGGWTLRNVGNGPALNVLVAQKHVKGRSAWPVVPTSARAPDRRRPRSGAQVD
jgi:hypothetical protein